MRLTVSDLLTKQSTMQCAIRGPSADFSVTGAKGPQKIKELLERIAGAANTPEQARELLDSLASQLDAVEGRLAVLKDSSKTAIGRSEDRDNPWNPAMHRHHFPVPARSA
jgi:hypothetical protein